MKQQLAIGAPLVQIVHSSILYVVSLFIPELITDFYIKERIDTMEYNSGKSNKSLHTRESSKKKKEKKKSLASPF